MIKEVIQSLKDKLDSAFIEGLKLKGIDFKNKSELQEFVKNNCTCDDNIDLKQCVYFVNEIPFLLHNYEIETPNFDDLNINKCSANFGYFVYL